MLQGTPEGQLPLTCVWISPQQRAYNVQINYTPRWQDYIPPASKPVTHFVLQPILRIFSNRASLGKDIGYIHTSWKEDFRTLPPLHHLLEWNKKERAAFLWWGSFKPCFPISLHPIVRARKENHLSENYERAQCKTKPISIFKWVELLILVPTPNPLFPQESKPQDKKNKNYWGLSYPVSPPPFFSVSSLVLSFCFRTSGKTPGDWGFNPFLW